MELYLIRHGQTDWNKEGRLQGSIDIELNENGKEMAVAAGKRLENIFFNKIYSSPLSRAFTTAKLIRGNKNTEIIIDERLKEVSFGCMEGESYEKWTAPDSPYRYFFSQTETDKYFPPEGGESLVDLCARTKAFIQEEIEPQCHSAERIMIVAHGALLASVMCYLDNHGISNFWGDGLRKNCQETVYAFDSATGTWHRK
ncbi:MAG: histidine phosphatase family protein [Treponema sp.]|nr:histidine phosphatase family protein [Treponema sp.]